MKCLRSRVATGWRFERDADPDLTIRFATGERCGDIHAALVGIAETVKELHKLKSTPEDIRRFGFGEAPAFETLIAEVDGRFAGMLPLSSPASRPGSAGPASMCRIFTSPMNSAARASASRLLQRLAAVTRKRGGCYIRLAVDTQNLDAQAFYTRLGIKHSDTEQIHAAYGDDFDALADADREG